MGTHSHLHIMLAPAPVAFASALSYYLIFLIASERTVIVQVDSKTYDHPKEVPAWNLIVEVEGKKERQDWEVRVEEVMAPTTEEVLNLTRTKSELTWAIAALLHVQSLDGEMLPRALKIPPHVTYDGAGLLRELRSVGPRLAAAADGPAPSSDDVLEGKLARIVGLLPIKEKLRSLRKDIVINRRRRELNAPVIGDDMLHMVFQGNPGSGKTSIARLVAELLFDLGVIPGRAFVEVQRADLVAEYVGTTAPMTRAKVQAAKGGVLFVDEAPRLSCFVGRASNDFGREAIEELMKDLTTGDPLVILAGYSEGMDQFFATNIGLKRRFPLVFEFPDYTPRELAEMFSLKVASKGFRLGASLGAGADGGGGGSGGVEDAVAGLIEDHTTAAWRSTQNGAIADALLVGAVQTLNERLPEDFSREAAETLELIDLRAAALSLMRHSRM
mmetsp:Transcript_32522/g.83612  ORF Transcript_32522/g.83612 Transcript_32522/m.83612 type:complete len:443 (-) Transcript_32522:100-1428(-)